MTYRGDFERMPWTMRATKPTYDQLVEFVRTVDSLIDDAVNTKIRTGRLPAAHTLSTIQDTARQILIELDGV